MERPQNLGNVSQSIRGRGHVERERGIPIFWGRRGRGNVGIDSLITRVAMMVYSLAAGIEECLLRLTSGTLLPRGGNNVNY